MRQVHRVVGILEVGRKLVGGIPVGAPHDVLVKLPEILEARRGLESLQRRRAATLPRAVVENGNARCHCIHRRRRFAPVPRGLIHVDHADAIVRTEQEDLLVPRQVAEVGESEHSVLHDHADRRGIFGIAGLTLLDIRAVGVRRARSLDLLAEGFNDGDVESPDRNLVARRDHLVLPFRERGSPVFRVRPDRLLHRRHVLQGRTVIDEHADGELLGQVRNPAGMIAVKMRGEQRVNPGDLGDPGDVGDTRGIAPRVLVWIRSVETGKAGVDHERLTRRRDEQRGLTALGVDEVDVERVRLADHRDSHHGGETQRGG